MWGRASGHTPQGRSMMTWKATTLGSGSGWMGGMARLCDKEDGTDTDLRSTPLGW